jgi:digeranylgeranylglycerophospholipid reductase
MNHGENNSMSSRPGRENEEILVVGGSAAGLYAAGYLARAGKRVRVLESRPTLETSARTLIVTDHFRSQISSEAKSCILNEINRFELFTDGRSAQFSLKKPDLIIERSRLIRSLSNEAVNGGAELNYNTRFLGLSPNGAGLNIAVDQSGERKEYHAQSVVGADGAVSRVARAAGWPPVETVPLVQAVIKLPRDCPPDTTRVWFMPDDTPYFYWLIPESGERAAVGVIGENGQAIKICFDRFLAKKGFEPLEWQGARIPVYKRWVPVQRAVGSGKVYLVGDAAAQVKVSTVGGIVTGLRGARGVADAILHNGKSELLGLRRELSTHWLIRRTLHYFQQEDYSRLVDMLNDSTRESLGEINRDESTRLLWNVVRTQPRLVLMGLRGLLLGKK